MIAFILAIVSLIVGAFGGFVGGVLVYRNNSDKIDEFINKFRSKDVSEQQIAKGRGVEIVFLEPDRLHPHSDSQSISDVGKALEARYHIIENFCKDNYDYILARLSELYLRESSQDRANRILESDIRAKWRDYILQQLHGMSTKASRERGDPAFVDSGAYYKGLTLMIQA